MDDVEKIAKGLTKAQREALARAYEHNYGWGIPMSSTRTTTFTALRKRGLIDGMWYVQPLGIAVRAHLIAQEVVA